MGQFILELCQLFRLHLCSPTNKHYQDLLSALRLSDNHVPPEATPNNSIIRLQFQKIISYELLNNSHNKLSVTAYNGDIPWRLYHYCPVVVTSFVKANDSLPFLVSTYCELALATIAVSLTLALHKLLHF